MKQLLPGLILCALCAVFPSCSKELIKPLDAETVAVVESYIIAGDSSITLRVSKLLPFSTDTLETKEYIPGLQILLNGDPMLETEPGVYTLLLGSGSVQPGSTYSMKFLYGSDSISSETVVPELPSGFAISESVVYTDRISSSGGGFGSGPMEDIDLTWENEDAGYFYVTVEYLESTPDYINENMEDEEVPVMEGIAPIQASGTRLGMRNLHFFGHYRIVLSRVNQDFADLYQHLAANSNNITNPVTSIQNGFGVFTSMSTDTVYLEVREN